MEENDALTFLRLHRRGENSSSGVNSTILAQTQLDKGLGMTVGLVAHFLS